MVAQTKISTRLCPHCANSIGVDALICPYCKADMVLAAEPEWPDRGEIDPVIFPPEKERLTVKSKAILALGLLVFALGIYLVGGNVERHDMDPVLEEQKALIAEQQNLLKEKDQRIESLEAQLAQIRHDNQGTSAQIKALRAQLDERQKDLAAAQNRLTAANRQLERLAASRVAAAPQPPARTSNPPAPAPTIARVTGTTSPRTYETVRPTPVYQEPVDSARVVAQIGKGTEIVVVGSGGGWLEIRSRHGKPPGFIHADDAMFVSRSN